LKLCLFRVFFILQVKFALALQQEKQPMVFFPLLKNYLSWPIHFLPHLQTQFLEGLLSVVQREIFILEQVLSIEILE